jgi:hypothetical protein
MKKKYEFVNVTTYGTSLGFNRIILRLYTEIHQLFHPKLVTETHFYRQMNLA